MAHDVFSSRSSHGTPTAVDGRTLLKSGSLPALALQSLVHVNRCA